MSNEGTTAIPAHTASVTSFTPHIIRQGGKEGSKQYPSRNQEEIKRIRGQENEVAKSDGPLCQFISVKTSDPSPIRTTT